MAERAPRTGNNSPGWLSFLRKNTIIKLYEDSNGKVIIVAVNVDLSHYLYKKSKYDLKELEGLSKNMAELLKSIDQRDKLPGLSARTLFIGIDEQLMGFGIFSHFGVEFSRHLYKEGYRKFFARATSKKVATFLKKHGGQVLSTAQFSDKKLK